MTELDSLKRLVERIDEDLKKKEETDDKYKEKTDKRLNDLETTTLMHGKDIQGIQQTLGDIKDDTKWLRRTITGSLIGGGISGFIGLIIWLAQT